MTLVCLDTQIIQWGVLKSIVNPAQQHLVSRSTALVNLLEKNGDSVILPSIALGELLVPIPQDRQGEVLKRLRRNWMIADFDSLAALKFAQMRHGRPTSEALSELQKTNPSASRVELIADTLIAATALAHNASIFYTNDQRFRTVAGKYINTILLDDLDLPDPQIPFNFPKSNPPL